MPVTSPAYARLAAVLPDLRVSEGEPRSGAGWVTAEQLAAGGAALDAFTAEDAEGIVHQYGRPPRPDVAATLALHRYAWPACLLFTVPWFLHRRVPRLPVADVSLHRATGRMTVRTRAFGCLPGDPAATLPGACVLPTEAALRDELRAALAEHLTPVLGAFRPRLRRGPRTLWGLATDEIAESLWYVGRLMDREERAVADLTALLPGNTAPYAGGAHFRGAHFRSTPRAADTPDATAESGCSRDRLTCCLFYTVSPAEACGTCPRATGSDRIRRRATVG
ncbi:(2Fe-2S)-binding protein [Actinacidiphila paucisporea]|uniref:FhuF 2Fe-2S C-terminal domain-containing protein n=1 Tax=Actinacidiphila paucisporea TaxID=310782 RepID=A0A1M7KBW1_9ACTN|nr:(2Fe-2S)-binding protein [Actinacidiphila paucisporea]SHM62483.1 FhuF 2Fe-2S C-terminal domain-containing protein [Actinacidiphila paucisporea]